MKINEEKQLNDKLNGLTFRNPFDRMLCHLYVRQIKNIYKRKALNWEGFAMISFSLLIISIFVIVSLVYKINNP